MNIKSLLSYVYEFIDFLFKKEQNMNMDEAFSIDPIMKLRQEIRRLEGFKTVNTGGVLPLNIPPLQRLLPKGGLDLGAIHEFISDGYEESASATAFSLALLSGAPHQGPIVWIARDNIQYAPGFVGYGIEPQRIIFVRPYSEQQVLWVMEEALRHKGLFAVVAHASQADLTATRRLQLAAEEGGAAGFLMRNFCTQTAASSCMTRWQIRPAPSMPEYPGLGFPRWDIELQKARGGKTGSCIVEWKDNIFHVAAPVVADSPQQSLHSEGMVLRFSRQA